MNKPIRFEYPGFTGGVNQEVPASALGETEVSMAVNFKPSESGIRSRGGLRRLFTHEAANGAAELALGLQTAARSGTRGILVLGQVHATWYPPDFVNPTELGLLGSSQDTEPWSSTAWNDSFYAARTEDGLWIVQLAKTGFSDFVGAAGAETPTNTITAVEGAAGVLTAADYGYAEAFYDSRTGTTSDRGPITTVTVGASKTVDLGNFSTVPSARFDQRVLYRTLPDGTGALYQIAIIDADEVSYNDNIPIDEQGAAASSENTAPVDGIFALAAFQGRLWITDGSLLYPSQTLNPDAFPTRLALKIGQDDNEDIVDIIALPTRLIVGKRKSIWSVTGTGATSFAIEPIDRVHGVVAKHSMTEMNGLIMYPSDDDYYVTDGVNPAVPLSGQGKRKLKPFFQNRDGTESLVGVPVPLSDGVILGLGSRVVSRELTIGEGEEEEELLP